MSPLHADYLSAPRSASKRKKVVEERRRRAPSPDVATSTWMCLVLSVDEERRRRLIDVAEEAGWRAVACGSVEEAVLRSERWKTHLAVMDLRGLKGSVRNAVRDFTGRLAKKPEPLLMVCADATAEDELWARQLGVWLYLPAPELNDDLVALCSEALVAVQKQQESMGVALKSPVTNR